MKILFVCAANRFRSKSAEALFNKYNKNKKIEVKSAGARIDIMSPFMAESVISELKKRRAFPNTEAAEPANELLIKWADKIIIVANNVDPSLFPEAKTEVWPVKDASEYDLESTMESIDDIDVRVKKLVDSLKNAS